MGTREDREMEAALIADGEKLRQLTGEDHGPWAFECQNCIGMMEHGCYCAAMGASQPGGPRVDLDDLEERCGDNEPEPEFRPRRIRIDPRLAERISSGTQSLAILPSPGLPKPPRYAYPAVARVGDTLELYVGDERLFGDETVRCTFVQAVSMQRKPDYSCSQVGGETAAFPCYLSEEKALTEMDGFASDAERFAHYCPDGTEFNGHIIHWKREG